MDRPLRDEKSQREIYILAYYENVFIARQDVSATQVEELTENFGKIIDSQGGKVVSVESWGLRSLAYRIKKNRKGHYVMMHLDAPAAAIHEMERQMGINENVLRQLTIKIDEIPEGPSVMMRSHTRDDRPRRHPPVARKTPDAEESKPQPETGEKA